MLILSLAAAVSIAVSAASAPSSLAAAGITVNTTGLNLSRAKPSGLVRVSNNKAAVDNVHVHIYEWHQADGRDELIPSDDLIAGPLIFSVPPGGTQTVRVGMRGPLGGDGEKTYRVVVGEIPPDARLNRGMAIAVEFSFPVYVAPVGGLRRDVEWTVAWVDARRVRLTARNTGNVHARFEHLQLNDHAAQVALVEEPKTILAGQSASWTFDLAHAMTAGSPLTMTAISDSGPVKAELR